ncbi:MAG: formyltransferase [Pseudomonadota bacterium]|nr:formyltransferase [Pseudomonadota bacterium]
MKASAIVFAYHDVGVRCLKVLLHHKVNVRLVVTHEDSSDENIWFQNVQMTANDYGLPSITPADPNTPELLNIYRQTNPDFIFSFYYRHLLSHAVLDIPMRGAYNMHGSLLPKFRGRAPVNWAVLKGETETGATLHKMNDKPDAGDIYAAERVPILSDDTALEVFNKVTLAAEIALDRILPALLDGTASATPQNQVQATYFGKRKAEDGKIDWTLGARELHNLIRAVAPPYPGAFTDIGKDHFILAKTLCFSQKGPLAQPGFFIENENIYCQCADMGILLILKLFRNDKVLTPKEFETSYGKVLIPG